MAEFKIDGRMTVRTLKESFKKEFEGTLRVYNGRELADDNATLASIRQDDAKGGELVCRASRTVGKFEEEMKDVFGIKVQVASPDDYVLALDGITLANIKNIKKYATKADMEELVAYKRQNTDKDVNERYADYPIFDFKFKKVDWELNEDNIEERREEIDIDGVIYVRAYTEDDDFETRVISNCDIADGLYDAIDMVNDFMDDGWASAEVCYSTICKGYGTGRYNYELGSEFGYVLSDMFGCDSNWFDYSLDRPVICRAAGEDWEQIWITDEWGNYFEDVDVDIDALIERHSGK